MLSPGQCSAQQWPAHKTVNNCLQQSGKLCSGNGKPCIIYTDHDTHTAALLAGDAADVGQGCSRVLQVPRRGNTVLMRGLVSILQTAVEPLQPCRDPLLMATLASISRVQGTFDSSAIIVVSGCPTLGIHVPTFLSIPLY